MSRLGSLGSLLRCSPFSIEPRSNTGQAQSPQPLRKPESYQDYKGFESWPEVTSGKPHIWVYVTWCFRTRRPRKLSIEWHPRCICEVLGKRKCLCFNVGSIPKSFPFVHSNFAAFKKNMKFQTHLVSSISEKGPSVCIPGHILSCNIWQLPMSMCSML